MKAVHLDTNFLIRALDPTSPSARAWETWLERDIHLEVSTVAWAEFLCGPVTARETELWREIIHTLHPLTRSQAEAAARLFNQTGRRSHSLQDCLIAAAAMEANTPLATENIRDFTPFLPLGLQLASLPRPR
jgi:predicted nucleic acid-binding protein